MFCLLHVLQDLTSEVLNAISSTGCCGQTQYILKGGIRNRNIPYFWEGSNAIFVIRRRDLQILVCMKIDKSMYENSGNFHHSGNNFFVPMTCVKVARKIIFVSPSVFFYTYP